MSVTSIQFAPLLPWIAIIILASLSLVAFLPGIWFQARGTGWRMLAALAVLVALTNPSLVEEERDPLKDVAAIVIDDSPSQGVGDRRARTTYRVQCELEDRRPGCGKGDRTGHPGT